MTPSQIKDMREACHILAEHIMRQPTRTNRCDWLKKEMVSLLLNPDSTEDLAVDYAKAYPYADIQNPYLAATLKDYDTKEDVL